MTAKGRVTSQVEMRHLVFIQYLRGIAAMMVVFHHVFSERRGDYTPLSFTDFGKSGVMIFFIISGFVMMHACRGERPVEFLRNRVIRVVPLYWVMTLIYMAILFRRDLALDVPFRRVESLVESLLFIPHYHVGTPTMIWPILVPGWTLNFEVFFFLIFSIGLVLRRPGLASGAIIAVLLVAGFFYDGSDPMILTWTHRYLFLFLAGMALAGLWQRVDFRPAAVLFPAGMLLLVLIAIGLIFEGWARHLDFVGAFMVVAGALGLQCRYPGWQSKLLRTLGDASYSIYLSHIISLVFIFSLLRLSPLDGWLRVVVHSSIAVVACTFVGVLVYRWIEKPLLTGLRRRFKTVGQGRQDARPPSRAG